MSLNIACQVAVRANDINTEAMLAAGVRCQSCSLSLQNIQWGQPLTKMDLLGGPGRVFLAGVDVLINQIPREGLGLWTGLF